MSRDTDKLSGINYNEYKFSRPELLKHIAIGGLFFLMMGWVFFDNLLLSLIACGLMGFYLKAKKQDLIKQRQNALLDAFKEAMYAFASALSAGRSVEQAFAQSLNDLKMLYQDEDDIVIEWQEICHKLNMNETAESAFSDFAKRSGVEDIENFSSVFVMAKRTGGNLIQIIGDTSELIREKIDIQKEIDVLIVQKQFEQRILSYIIPGMIVFFRMVTPDFLDPLYSTFQGRAVMVIALIMYLIAGRIGKRIVTIEV